MATRADDVVRFSDEKHGADVHALEARVDAAIEAARDPRQGVYCDLLWNGRPPSLVVKEELIRRYALAGWNHALNEGSDQREGSWCSITLRPAPEAPVGDYRD